MTATNTPLWLVEYYRKNPKTGETGWDIHFAWVDATSSREAQDKVAAHDPHFDCVILCNEQAEIFPLAGVKHPTRIR